MVVQSGPLKLTLNVVARKLAFFEDQLWTMKRSKGCRHMILVIGPPDRTHSVIALFPQSDGFECQQTWGMHSPRIFVHKDDIISGYVLDPWITSASVLKATGEETFFEPLSDLQWASGYSWGW